MQTQIVLIVAVLDNIYLFLDAASVQVDILSQTLCFLYRFDALPRIVLIVGQLRDKSCQPLRQVGFVIVVEERDKQFVNCRSGKYSLLRV